MICFIAYAWITMAPVVIVINPPIQVTPPAPAGLQMPVAAYHVARI